MEIPAALYGDYGAVAKRSRRAIRSYLRGGQGLWDALASDGVIDTAAHTGAIVVEGADRLRKDEVFFRCGVPLYLLLTDTKEWLTSAQEEDIFVSGIETAWGLLCMFDRQAMYGWFPVRDPALQRDRFARYVRAVLRHWDTLDAEGRRYASYAGRQKERLADIALGGGCALLFVLANLGVPKESLWQPLPEAGGLYALLAQADSAQAGDLVDLGQANAASWRARPVDPSASVDDDEEEGGAILEDVMVSEEMSAAMHADDPATVQRLIEAGEPVDRSDLDLLRSPLLWAAEGGYTDLVAFLLDRGANIEDRADEGESPLMLAASKGHKDIVRLLLSRGVDPSYVTDKGFDAVDFAEMGEHDDLVALLKQAQSSSG